MTTQYQTHKRALDSILASNSATEAARLLEVHRANIFHYIHRYDKKKVPPIIRQALIDKGYIQKRTRIRSQVNWETQEQKVAFLDYIKQQGYKSITEYARSKAAAYSSGLLYDATISLGHTDYVGEIFKLYPIDTGEDL